MGYKNPFLAIAVSHHSAGQTVILGTGFSIPPSIMIDSYIILPNLLNFQEVALNIDFAPTFADIAGHRNLSNIDGITLMPILHPNSNRTQPLRQAFLVEHQGEYTAMPHGCPQYKGQDMNVSKL